MKIKDGHEFQVLLGRDCVNIEICCDCQLRHITQYYMKRGKLYAVTWRDRGGTANLRRLKKLRERR